MPTQSLSLMAENFLERESMNTLTVSELISELESMQVALGDVPVYMTYEGCYDVIRSAMRDTATHDPDDHCVFLSREDPIT